MVASQYFTFFYYWGKHYDIIKIFQNSFVLIFWLFPSILSSICLVNLVTSTAEFVFIFLLVSGELEKSIKGYYPNIIFSKLVYSAFENELKEENSANTTEVNEMHSVEGKGEQGDTKKPEKNYFNKWVMDADFSKVKINNSFLWRRSEFTSARKFCKQGLVFFQELLAFKSLNLTLDTVLCECS